MPFEVFNVLCSDADTFMLKNFLTFYRFSVCARLVVSTRIVLFFSFLTVLGVPINDSICFSITKGDRLVIDLSSSSDLMTKNLGKLSEV